MRAVLLQEYGGPEKLRFENNVPDPQVSGDTVLIAAAAKVPKGARCEANALRDAVDAQTKP